MRPTAALLARVRVVAPAAPPLRRNLALAAGLVLFVGGAYAYTVSRMLNTELIDVAKELEAFRPAVAPAAAAPPQAPHK